MSSISAAFLIRFPVRAVIAAIFLYFIASPVAARGEQPSAVVKTLNVALLESMKKADELGYSGRRKILAPVVIDSFALNETARAAAGRYWRTFTDEQRVLYLKAYTDWTIATYAGRFDGYSGESFTVVSESAPVAGIVSVRSKLIRPKGEEVEFNYQLRQVKEGWKIVDIKISGISQLAVTRGQFVNILRRKGFKGLISMLNEKVDKLARGVGE